ncbi:MAG: hypothetical protein J6W60_11515, partial [Treponema sp.]|nr:hypothetical protein [Treponema sp.]
MSGIEDIDPEIAALLGDTVPDNTDSETSVDADEFDAALPVPSASRDLDSTDDNDEGIPNVDLSVSKFKPVEKFFEDEANPVFDDPKYYKTCFTGEDESAPRLHQLLTKYLTTQDRNDRSVYRQQIITAYWNFLRSLAPKMASSKTPLCKKLAMRYGMVLPSLFTPDQKEFFSRAILNNTTGEPILYMDEWLKEIAAGRLTMSVTDEVPMKKRGPGADQHYLQQLKSKNDGKFQSSESLLTSRENERERLEVLVQDKLTQLFEHPPVIGLDNHKQPYSDMQRKMFAEINQTFHQLQRVDKELAGYLRELQEAKEIRYSLEAKAAELPEETVNVGLDEILSEMTTVRQMAKMTCGRQGNQFPILTKEFFHNMDKDNGFREHVLRELTWIESIDPNCFCRIHRNIPNRIVPYVLLVPTYGDSGFCWEPFDRFNRITSRGRIVIPMYPRNLKIACLTAVGDLRWQVAKEKASFDWMSDGLTGQYYQYFEGKKMKGDVKQYFIEDYILWMTKEANGTQKLEKEVRAIFWRYLPFPQDRKDELKKRSLVYAELVQRDINRSMS